MDKARPIVLFLPWLGSTSQQCDKYLQVYKNFCFEVIVKESFAQHFLWPRCAMKDVERCMVKELLPVCSTGRKIIVHAFSIGCYFYGILLKFIHENPEKFGSIKSGICCQIIDSPVVGSYKEMSSGFAKGVVGSSLMGSVVNAASQIFFAATHSYTAKLHQQVVNYFIYLALDVPSVIYICKNDPFALQSGLDSMCKVWNERLSNVTVKLWDKSLHARHMALYPEEYKQLLFNTLSSVFGNNLKIVPKL